MTHHGALLRKQTKIGVVNVRICRGLTAINLNIQEWISTGLFVLEKVLLAQVL